MKLRDNLLKNVFCDYFIKVIEWEGFEIVEGFGNFLWVVFVDFFFFNFEGEWFSV